MSLTRWVAGLALATVLVGGAPPAPAPAAPRATHVAAVTVSFGSGNVVHRTVSFSSDSISGIDALRGAGFDVEAYGYSGIGAAVCRIDGVGRDPDASCLNGGTSYWAYWRNGQYSRVGAGATRVHAGDQEQWAWGSGTSAPPTTAFPTPTTTPPTSRPPATSAPPKVAPGAQGTAPAGSRPSGGSSTTADPSSTTTEQPSSTTAGPGISAVAQGGGGASGDAADERTSGDDESAAGGPDSGGPAGDGGGGSPLALAGFGVVLAAVVGLTLKARSARGTGASRN